MSITQFQKDLKNGASLEEALTDNKVTLKQAFDYAMQEHLAQAKTKKRKRKPYYRVDKYIYKYSRIYYIRRQFRTAGEYKNYLFGAYYTVEDAMKIRDCLDKYGWEQKRVDEYCKMCGVIRHKSRYQKVRYS